MMGSMVRIVIGFAVVCGLTLGVALTSAADSGFKYIGAKKCKTCHKKELIGDQYGKWEKAGHANAFKTLQGEKAIAVAKEKGISGPPSEAAECLKCHATAAGLGAGDVEKKPLKNSDGVQCESCHGPGSAYKKKKVMADHDKSLAAGLLVPDEKTCVKCHNDTSPTWTSFDYAEAKKKIDHSIPKDVKGKYIEVEKARKAEGK
jgi:cytochrome c peroxidase